MNQMIETAKGLGYLLVIDTDGELSFIRPIDREGYTPELSSPARFLGETNWKIQTAGMGSKTTDEIRKMMAGYANAILMVEYLKAWGF